MSIRSFTALHALFLVLALALGACKGGAGDTCKEEDDCGGGLTCCKEAFSVTGRGECQRSCDDGPAPADTGPADTGGGDAAPADTGAADTGAADTGAADTGAADTGAADTGAADTGAADTGAADTGAADTGADAT